jgi:hypothetical protein
VRLRSPCEGTVLIGERARWPVRPDECEAHRLARALLDGAGTSKEIEVGASEAGACRRDKGSNLVDVALKALNYAMASPQNFRRICVLIVLVGLILALVVAVAWV